MYASLSHAFDDPINKRLKKHSIDNFYDNHSLSPSFASASHASNAPSSAPSHLHSNIIGNNTFGLSPNFGPLTNEIPITSTLQKTPQSIYNPRINGHDHDKMINEMLACPDCRDKLNKINNKKKQINQKAGAASATGAASAASATSNIDNAQTLGINFSLGILIIFILCS